MIRESEVTVPREALKEILDIISHYHPTSMMQSDRVIVQTCNRGLLVSAYPYPRQVHEIDVLMDYWDTEKK